MRKSVLGDDLNPVKSAYAMQFSNPWVLATNMDKASENLSIQLDVSYPFRLT